MPRGERIDAALATLEENVHRETCGTWLEHLTAEPTPATYAAKCGCSNSSA